MTTVLTEIQLKSQQKRQPECPYLTLRKLLLPNQWPVQRKLPLSNQLPVQPSPHLFLELNLSKVEMTLTTSLVYVKETVTAMGTAKMECIATSEEPTSQFLIVPVVNRTVAILITVHGEVHHLHQLPILHLLLLCPLIHRSIPTPMEGCNIMRTTTRGITKTTGLDMGFQIYLF